MINYLCFSKARTLSKIHPGNPWPLGSSITTRGVNFSVASPHAEKVELLIFSDRNDQKPSEIFELNSFNHRSGDYWHAEIEELKAGCLYNYRVFRKYPQTNNISSASKVLLDPCARAIDGWDTYDRFATLNSNQDFNYSLKGVVCERDTFDFSSYPRPKHPWAKTIIYELHVGGFTQRADSGIQLEKRGSFLGLIEKIPYLKDLGITTIELLPIFSFDPSDAPTGRQNYWGYSPINWFTPHHSYVVGKKPLAARQEFRKLVEACHSENIEVILDVVYNHTTEGNKAGPSISWKGFSEEDYYYLNENNEYLDVSGCGNTIAANRPIVSQLIVESMRCWAIELGVDGFRFDLGIALSRGEKLNPLKSPRLFGSIESDPNLSDLKLISEPWDCGGLYEIADFPAKRISTWNGHFRDDLRRFWKGDKNSTWPLKDRLMGSPDLYKSPQECLKKTINFITSHDGFTLNDLVSFNKKHNLANGENNCDGDNNNHSWNHGVEGPTSNKNIASLRDQQKRNLLATLLLTPGVPMLLMGDEVSRSQGGNNNCWCQNNPLSWMIWNKDHCDQDLYMFVKSLLLIRQHLSMLFSPENPHNESKKEGLKNSDNFWIQWHGAKLEAPDWGHWSHTISYSINKSDQGSVMWIGLNAYSKVIEFALPKPTSSWNCIIDTSSNNPFDQSQKANIKNNFKTIRLQSRSMIALLSKEYASRVEFN